MNKRLIPTYVGGSVYELDPSFFAKKGITSVLFDLDNTLDDYTSKEPGDRAFKLKERFHASGITIYIASNNTSKRVKHYCERLGVDYTFALYKPFKKRLMKWMKEKGLEAKKTAFVGDQLLTDMVSANRAGLLTLLVNPLHPEKDHPFTWLNRHLEKPFRNKIYRKGLSLDWRKEK